MGWLRLVGSLKSSVSFAKEPYKRDCILQKRPIQENIFYKRGYDLALTKGSEGGVNHEWKKLFPHTCVCVCERERERERVCVCVNVCQFVCVSVCYGVATIRGLL